MISGGKRKPRYDSVSTSSPSGDPITSDDHAIEGDPLNLTTPVVELDGLPVGFVDSEHLPRHRDQWPALGSSTSFEVLRHDVRRSGRLQVRLWPLEPLFRNPRSAHWGHPDEPWSRIKARHPVDSTVTATVTSVRPANRWYTVAFNETTTRVTCLGKPPSPGTTQHYRVTKLLDTTHRIILPLDEPPH